MSKPSNKLTPFWRELLEKPWSEFNEMERDLSHSSSQAVVLSLVRACQKGKLPAIREGLDRIDGKLVTKVELEYPKFYFLYPYAELREHTSEEDTQTTSLPEVITPETTSKEEDEANKYSLRYALNRMSEKPRELVRMILDSAIDVDTAASYKGVTPERNPKVKAVIVASLLDMAHKGSMSAAFEVLDQIDGKVAEKIQLLGEPVYITRMDAIAPAGAEKNKEGVWQLVADNTTNTWTTSLRRENGDDKRRFGK